jgi:hypothetical protein
VQFPHQFDKVGGELTVIIRIAVQQKNADTRLVVGGPADDLLDLLYNGQRFPISRQKLEEGSTVFQQMFDLTDGEGQREELPIPKLDGISADDFAYFLAILEGQRVIPHRELILLDIFF